MECGIIEGVRKTHKFLNGTAPEYSDRNNIIIWPEQTSVCHSLLYFQNANKLHLFLVIHN